MNHFLAMAFEDELEKISKQLPGSHMLSKGLHGIKDVEKEGFRFAHRLERLMKLREAALEKKRMQYALSRVR